MNWKRLAVASLVGAGGYILHKILFRHDKESEENSRHGFFAHPHDKQIDELIFRVTKGTAYQLIGEAETQNCRDYFMQLLVELLEMRDPRMLSETSDTVSEFSSEGKISSKKVNQRTDDTEFKETLLYVIRGNLEEGHPLLERIIRAFHSENNPYTRFRIVRAVAKIGGEQARAFLEQVLADEGRLNTYSAQVAKTYLEKDD